MIKEKKKTCPLNPALECEDCRFFKSFPEGKRCTIEMIAYFASRIMTNTGLIK